MTLPSVSTSSIKERNSAFAPIPLLWEKLLLCLLPLREGAEDWIPDKFLRSAPKFSGMTKRSRNGFPPTREWQAEGGVSFPTILCHSRLLFCHSRENGKPFNGIPIRLNALCLVRFMFNFWLRFVIPNLIGNPLLIIPIYIFTLRIGFPRSREWQREKKLSSPTWLGSRMTLLDWEAVLRRFH